MSLMAAPCRGMGLPLLTHPGLPGKSVQLGGKVRGRGVCWVRDA